MSAQKVILLHGLGRSRASMLRMARAVSRAGFDAEPWGYPSRSHDTAGLERHLMARLAELRSDRPVHFVGHSLGCLMIRACLSNEDALTFPVGRIVMVAPPNAGAGIVTRLRERPWAAWTMRRFGKPVHDLAPGSGWLKSLPVPRAETGVIAGTMRFNPINPSAWFNMMFGTDEEHDGTVELASTHLPGMKDFIALKADHTFICDYPEVIRQTIAFLSHGRFDHGAAN